MAEHHWQDGWGGSAEPGKAVTRGRGRGGGWAGRSRVAADAARAESELAGGTN